MIFDTTNIHHYSEEYIIKTLKYLNEKYYLEGNSIVSDEVYDYLYDYVKEHYPDNPFLDKIGVSSKSFVTLPHYMGSMDKIKNNQKELDKWGKRNIITDTVLISDKLDGVSALLIKCDNSIKLYTRGDGNKGQDISNIFPYLKNTENISDSKNFTVRGELIIRKNDFNSLIQKNEIKVTSNCRNTVAGIVNAKKPNLTILKQICFIGYEVLSLNIIPSDQMNMLKQLGIECVYHDFCDKLSIDFLKDFLQSRKCKSDFDIDGLVIINNELYEPIKHGNPKYAFAFKNDFEEAIVNVIDVIWNLSKDAYLIPTIEFETVKLNKVDVKKATGFNAKFIYDNKINIGSKLLVTRSGEVVPYVKSVLSISNEPKMPSCNYKWNQTNVHILMEDNDDLKRIRFQHMVSTLNIRGVSSNISKKLFESNIDSFVKLFNVSKSQLINIDGIKSKSADNILSSLETSKSNLTYELLMVASNCFGRGFGIEHAKSFIHHFPNFLHNIPTIEQLKQINGTDIKTAQKIHDNIPSFINFIHENEIKIEQQNNMLHSNILKGFYIVFSGQRNKQLINTITNNGGIIETNITKKTTHLIIDSIDHVSSKYNKAIQNKIKIVTSSDFYVELTNLSNLHLF